MKIARNVLEPDKHSDGGGECFALKKTTHFWNCSTLFTTDFHQEWGF